MHRTGLQLASFFHQFDLDGSGLVEVEEFRRVLEAHQVGQRAVRWLAACGTRCTTCQLVGQARRLAQTAHTRR